MTRPIKEIFFKPKWQHKNAKIRAAAVAHSHDQRLIEQLPNIARQDEHESVRLAALKRLSDLYPVMRIASEDDNQRVRDHATRMLREMLAGQRDCSNTASERLEIIPKLDETEMIEYLVRNATETEIRLELIPKIKRTGTLADLAMEDEASEVREAAVAQIDRTATLERIAAHARKRDKKLYRIIQHRLEHDSAPDTSQAYQDDHARALCVEIEQLVRSALPREEKKARLSEIESAWSELDLGPTSEWAVRYTGAHRIIESSLIEKDDNQQSAAEAADSFLSELQRLMKHEMDLPTTERMIADLDRFDNNYPGLSHAHHSAIKEARISLVNRRRHHLDDGQVNETLLAICDRLENSRRPVSQKYLSRQQDNWATTWHDIAEPTAGDHSTHERFRHLVQTIESEFEQREEKRHQLVTGIDEKMDRLEQALEEGHLATCVKHKQRILDDLSLIGKHSHVNSTAFKSRLNSARGRLRELRDWQRWSNNKVRESLIDEAETTAQSAMHPDAMAQKVKQLQKQWRDLDLGERLPGEKNYNPARGALWERFHQACNEAFEPAKAFFDKRSELRGQHETRLKGICDDLDHALAHSDELDIKAKERLIALARKSLRDVSELQPSHRKKIAGKLRHGANQLDNSLEEIYQINQRKKEKLLDQLIIASEGDLDEAIETAKSLQAEWKKIGPARYKLDQKLWRKFRKINDDVFNRRQSDQAKQDTARSEQKQVLFQVLDEMKASLDSAETADELDQLKTRFQRQWAELANEDKKMDRIFSQQLIEFGEKARRLHHNQRQQHRVDLLDMLQLCVSLQASSGSDSKAESEWSALDPESIPSALSQRWEAIKEDSLQGDDADRALAVVMQMECICGVETPAEYKQQRMDYQVKRLSDHMSGEDRDTGEEMESLLTSLISLVCRDVDLQSDILVRARTAVLAYNKNED